MPSCILKCFPHKHENLDLETTIHAKRPGVVAHTCNPLAGDTEAVQIPRAPWPADLNKKINK